jgi:hypothetical protein
VAVGMKFNLLQKVAKSSCINKATYILDKMMCARNLTGANSSRPFMGKMGKEVAFFHKELNQQETEFLMLSKVLLIICSSSSSMYKLYSLLLFVPIQNQADTCIERTLVPQNACLGWLICEHTYNLNFNIFC